MLLESITKSDKPTNDAKCDEYGDTVLMYSEQFISFFMILQNVWSQYLFIHVYCEVSFIALFIATQPLCADIVKLRTVSALSTNQNKAYTGFWPIPEELTQPTLHILN